MKNLLKISIIGIIALICMYTPGLAVTASVTALDGDVQFIKSGSSDWQSAEVGFVLSDGDKISSKENSWAEISMENGHQVKIGPESYMTINSLGTKTNLELFKGSLFSKVKTLKGGESYNVKAPETVCSVRGTEFNVNIGQEGQTQVLVYEGSVLAKEINTGEAVVVNAGKYTVIIKNQPPSEPDDIAELESSQRSQDPEEGEEEEEDKEEAEAEEEEEEDDDDEMASFKEDLRQEIKEAVNDIKVEVISARDVVEETKETDSATGRTLKDIHGNLVRIEQYLLRPQPDTVQFINITKRSDYKYSGNMNVSGTGARLDSIEFKAKFNREMPEKISQWFSFFQDLDEKNELDNFHPEEIVLKISNQKDSYEMNASWEGTDADGDMGDPVIKLISATNGEWNVVIDDYNDYTAGDARLNYWYKDVEGEGIMWDSEDTMEMWAISPKVLLYKDLNNNGKWDESEATSANTKMVRTGIEGWMINNEGKPISFDMFESGNVNPFEIVKNIAFEASFVVRYGGLLDDNLYILNQNHDNDTTDWEENSANQSSALLGFKYANNFFSNNIDLVVTPDFAIPILEEIAKGSAESM